VSDEQRGQRGLAAAALACERDLHDSSCQLNGRSARGRCAADQVRSRPRRRLALTILE
jgi:hypothetical protein